MEAIDFFKLQAKNLLKDYKTRFYDAESGEFRYFPKFFNVKLLLGERVGGFSFTLMNAQHVIAKLAGFSGWQALIHADKVALKKAKEGFCEINGFLNKISAETVLSPEGQSGLFCIADSRDIIPVETFALFLEHGFDVNRKLYIVPLSDKASFVTDNAKLLGKSPEADIHSTTHLHIVKRSEIAEALILHGADVNARDGLGRTPLHYARLSKNEKLIAVLCKHGATE